MLKIHAIAKDALAKAKSVAVASPAGRANPNATEAGRITPAAPHGIIEGEGGGREVLAMRQYYLF
jgi:hypothetical protein